MDVVDPARYAAYAARSTPDIMNLLESTLERVIYGQIDGQPQGSVGVLLSGGVDSTVIAALATRHASLRSYNFSAWSDSVLDERRMAERVAQKLGLPFESMKIDAAAYRRELARATWLFEMPLWHMQGVPTHLLARRAFADGIRILLSGVSIGPMLGAASDRYRWVLPPPFLSKVPPGVFRVARKAVYTANGLPIANPYFVRNLGFGVRLVDGGARARTVARCSETYEFLQDSRERRVHVMRMSDNALFLPRFFRQGDSLCMGESVEYCDASVDTDYMALALNLRTDLIFHRKIPKWILKELATRYVPREISFQKKHAVWNVPVDQYFAPMFRESYFRNGFLESFMGLDWRSAKELYDHEREKSQILYRLVNIETWGRLFFMGQSVDEVTSLLLR
jgi:asparagine synthase (glutamine-hydrolysing)